VAGLGCALLLSLLAPAAAFAQPAADTAASSTTTAAPAADEPVKGLISEPYFLTKNIKRAARFGGEGGGRQTSGFYPDFSDMISGSGWISAGPGYRHWLFHDKAIVDTSAAISWRAYTVVQGRFELPNLAHDRVAIGTQGVWQDATQITYFGVGPDTIEAMRSEYRMKTTDVVGFATLRPARHFDFTSRLGMLQSPKISEPSGWFQRGNPAAQETFPDDPVFLRGSQPDYFYGEFTATADTRPNRSHPTEGGVYRGTWSSYSDRDGGSFSFRRYEAEGAQFIPVAGRRVVFALHGWLAATDTDPGDIVPFYMMPSLGDGSTLRSFTGYRFHDNNMAVVNFETRLALMTHVDVAGYVGAGNVAPKLSQLNLGKHEYGVGLRVHSIKATLLRLDATHGPEGWRIIFRQSDPFHLTRLKKKTATAPFVQ
jgi:hypothetical protein